MKSRTHQDDDEDYNAQDEEAENMADNESPDGYEPGICVHCNGSGEGQYDGSTCRFCKGKGEI